MKSLFAILILMSHLALAQTRTADELYQNTNSEQKAKIEKELAEKGISQDELKDIEVTVDPDTKQIDVSSRNEIGKKHALYIALRLGFPLLAGVGVVYRNEGEIPFNVTLNAQTVILASSYNAGIAWNFYKGFFVGAVAHYIRTNNVWGGGNEHRFFFGPQVGYQHSFGKTKRWYIDGRTELLITEDNVVPNVNVGIGVRFW